VSTVELSKPPITTDAKGRCTSAPVEVEMAIVCAEQRIVQEG
jgi:hypothetical protein